MPYMIDPQAAPFSDRDVAAAAIEEQAMKRGLRTVVALQTAARARVQVMIPGEWIRRDTAARPADGTTE